MLISRLSTIPRMKILFFTYWRPNVSANKTRSTTISAARYFVGTIPLFHATMIKATDRSSCTSVISFPAMCLCFFFPPWE